jgi:hypothetical protein
MGERFESSLSSETSASFGKLFELDAFGIKAL